MEVIKLKATKVLRVVPGSELLRKFRVFLRFSLYSLGKCWLALGLSSCPSYAYTKFYYVVQHKHYRIKNLVITQAEVHKKGYFFQYMFFGV